MLKGNKMRIGITGEQGFIAVNLAKEIENQGNTFVSLDNSVYANEYMAFTESDEVCVYRNSVDDWVSLFDDLDLDVIVHNAAVVGTDVVALNPDESVMTNVLGTKKITEAANISGITTVYTGTTVIYDTLLYQDCNITEESSIFPRTDYSVQKYAGEMFVRNNANDWLVVRPLFAYGGVGDMNSLIAKSLFAVKNNIQNIDMFLDPEKIKDYMHVEDFCCNVVKLINSNIRNNHFNITAENPLNTTEIISLIEKVTGVALDDVIKWHPHTDYLGNHRLSNQKFKNQTGITNARSLEEGIIQSWLSISSSSSDYNPLKYLNEAKRLGVDLIKHFPKIS
jgi:nucleoside-diphosphate-sugar epimerase